MTADTGVRPSTPRERVAELKKRWEQALALVNAKTASTDGILAAFAGSYGAIAENFIDIADILDPERTEQAWPI